MIHHLVLLRFKKDAKKPAIAALFAELVALQQKIPGILSFAGGPYSSPEGFNKGYTHGFAMVFKDAKSRDAYLPHPEHEKVKAKILALLEGGLDGGVAFDFEA
ncbi:MAG: Dabb family protein [Planctomycetes bacterium]|nr:Dabb family protein [Planctomycetota bacterium]